MCLVQKGDKALAGEEEKDIRNHRFPPDNTKERKICFKGYYLSIYNQVTGHYAAHIDGDTATTEYREYMVPPRYSVFVKQASVYFVH